MLVLLTTLQVRSKALASSLLRFILLSLSIPKGGFFNNSKVETLRIRRPKQRSNQRQARGLPSSVLHYLVWLKLLLPPVLGAEVVGRSECLKHAMKFNRTKRQLRQEIWMHCRKQHPMHSRHRAPFSCWFLLKSVKSAFGFESWWFGCAAIPFFWDFFSQMNNNFTVFARACSKVSPTLLAKPRCTANGLGFKKGVDTSNIPWFDRKDVWK